MLRHAAWHAAARCSPRADRPACSDKHRGNATGDWRFCLVLRCSHEACGQLAARSWIAATWRFLLESKIKLTDPLDKPQLARPEDSFLMERFFAHNHRGTEVAHSNTCRAHLRALRLSDSCMADEQRLMDDAMEVQLDPHRSLPFSWPHTHRPKSQIRVLWRSASCKVCCGSTAPRALVQPLSPFLPSTSST